LTFNEYAKFYDALYSDKDYEFETAYINQLIQAEFGQAPLALLEFGSGTGKHGALLASSGHSVTGVEPSQSMIDRSEAHPGFTIERGYIESWSNPRRFSVCLAMFHVLSYLSTPTQLENALSNVREHLEPGGLFVFDVWHGPAVEALGVERRSKQVEYEGATIIRKAVPELKRDLNQVSVSYEFEVFRAGVLLSEFQETHLMKYYFPEYLTILLKENNMRIVKSCESFSDEVLSTNTWSALYVAKLEK
jgi:SAM-dependent methyltransferase